MDFSTLMGMSGPQQEQPVAGGYSAAMEPDPAVTKMLVPPANAEELEQRKTGWRAVVERVTSDPNLMRALGMAGAHMAQPIPIGQTQSGHLAKSYMVGQAAFDAGDYAKRQQDVQTQEQARRDKVATAEVASREATTATERARLPGVVAGTRVNVETADTKISAAKEELTKLKAEAQKATTEAEAAAAAAKFQKRKDEILKGIPDATIRSGLEAEFALPGARVAQAKAGAAASTAAARASNVDATKGEITLSVLQDMQKNNPAELKQFLTKTGPYSANTSGIAQQADMWGKIYDGLPDTHPSKKGKTRTEFQMEELKSAKVADVSRRVKDIADFYERAGIAMPPDVQEALVELTRNSLGASRGKVGDDGGAGATADKPTANAKWTNSSDGKSRWTTLPNGKIFMERIAAPASAPVEAP